MKQRIARELRRFCYGASLILALTVGFHLAVVAQADSRPKLPTRAKVGSYTYTISYKVEEQLWGSTDFESHEIHIKPGMAIDREREVVLHELLHAAMWRVGRVLSLASGKADDCINDDQFIEATSPDLIEAFRDNPELVAYLASK